MPDIATTPVETIEVRERTVACDGGGDPLGHPRVYLKIVDGEITCPYCSRHYVLVGLAADTEH
ncbi:MAG: zinc-finger domain-containing protein [Acidiphilium sp.]